jgi:drug/metabolite transporter (DMT)-like permease
MTSARNKALWVTLAMISGALEPIMTKFGYRGDLQPIPLFFVRNLIAALVLLPIVLRAGASWNSKSIREIMPASLLLMLTGFCTLLALNYMSAVTVITVVTTTPAVVALINQKMGRDRLAKYFWLGFILCFVGVVMSLDFAAFTSNTAGLIAVLVAVFSSSIYRVKMEVLTDKFPPAWTSAVCFVLIGLFSVFLFALKSVTSGALPIPSVASLPWCLGIGVAAALANVSFVTALNKVGSTRISIISMLQRPLLIGFAAVVLQEQPTAIQIIGIILVVIGMNYAKVERISETEEDPKKIPVAQTEP